MNINKFNKKLAQMSATYECCQQLKKCLSQWKYEQIIDIINAQMNQASGYIDKDFILKKVNQMSKQPVSSNYTKLKDLQFQNNIRKFDIEELNELFPFGKVSYTVLIKSCLRGINQNLTVNQLKQISKIPENTLNYKQNLNPFDLIWSIVYKELQIMSLRNQLIPLVQLYIPISEKNLTLEQLKDYLLLKQSTGLEINPQFLIQSLNGYGGSKDKLEFQFYGKKENQEKQNEPEAEQNQQSFSKIDQIMKRLDSRVSNFGKQWLINKLQEQSIIHQKRF